MKHLRWPVTVLVLFTVILPLSSCKATGLHDPGKSHLSMVADVTRATWLGKQVGLKNLADYSSAKSEPVGVVFRGGGVLYARTWASGGSTLENLQRAIVKGKEKIGFEKAARVNRFQVSLTHTYKNSLKISEKSKIFSKRLRGILGLELKSGEVIELYAPSYFTATNRSPNRVVRNFFKQHKLSGLSLTDGVFARTFESEEIFVALDAAEKPIKVSRGKRYVPMQSVNRKRIEEMAAAAIKWLSRSVGADGRMTYKYWPSSGKDSKNNNILRQWMGSFSLVKGAKYKNDPRLFRIAEKNIDYNLKKFYRQEGSYGLLEYNEKIKLGTLSFAVLAIINHPNRKKWSRYERAFRATITSLWNANGSFNTFYKPKTRNDNQNFYPGETLLLMAELYKLEKDPAILKKALKSFRHYQNWHNNNWNPAFIPWQTLAYYRFWKVTGNPEFSDFIFKMNDRLILMQQWLFDSKFRDLKGRFYSTSGLYGPPHASSTGIYIEGLIDAYKLAIDLQDTGRQKKYARAIQRGFRSLMQLQFTSNTEMFFVSRNKRNRVYGGLRTTVYDNTIRTDNVQHSLNASISYLSGKVNF